MTRAEHLLVTTMEECDEVSYAISKALRFGLDDCYPVGTSKTAEYRILEEYYHLQCMMNMLFEEEILTDLPADKISEILAEKAANVNKNLPANLDCINPCYTFSPGQSYAVLGNQGKCLQVEDADGTEWPIHPSTRKKCFK